MNKESGRSMIEMILVLALMGVITIGSIKAYQNGNNQNEANKITELVSIASTNGLTKMKNYPNATSWQFIGKNKNDYSCISSLIINPYDDSHPPKIIQGSVKINFGAGCDKIKNILIGQWGDRWNAEKNIYTPPKDEE